MTSITNSVSCTDTAGISCIEYCLGPVLCQGLFTCGNATISGSGQKEHCGAAQLKYPFGATPPRLNKGTSKMTLESEKHDLPCT